jgi:hypothetical protein
VKELFPAAQAVLTAVTQQEYCLDPSDVPEATGRIKYEAAAALRAAANQVVPPEQERLFNEERPWDGELCAVVEIRQQLLAIADELEGHA